MWNLRRILELRDSAQSNNWSDVLSLYFWRAKEADLRMARMINNLSVKLSAVIEEYQLFAQELEASPGWVVNKDRSIEYLQELVQRDGEMVQRLQALEREVGERADEKLLFIEKLKGNLTHTGGHQDSSPWLVLPLVDMLSLYIRRSTDESICYPCTLDVQRMSRYAILVH
ncbi:hypothetical protein Tco_1118046 [Tanacetum coccineum]